MTMNAQSQQKHADIHSWQKYDFVTIKELVRHSKLSYFCHHEVSAIGRSIKSVILRLDDYSDWLVTSACYLTQQQSMAAYCGTQNL